MSVEYPDQACEYLSAIRPWRGKVPRGFLANWLGVHTSIEFVKTFHSDQFVAEILATDREVATECPKLSDGESFFEYAAILNSVLHARARYVMIELGGGWAQRAVDSAKALQQLNPIPTLLVVVEPIPGYFAWAQRHFRTNGLNPADHWLLNAAVSDSNTPQFMNLITSYLGNQIDDPQVWDWVDSAFEEGSVSGSFLKTFLHNPYIRMNDAQGNELYQLGFVSCVTLDDILGPLDRVDYLDVDIQHAEVRVLPPAMDFLNRKVRLIHVGTHSSLIHEHLRALFLGDGWEVLADFLPDSRYDFRAGSFKTTDGVLTVLNPRA
jgi:FkbM family methyltransferase